MNKRRDMGNKGNESCIDVTRGHNCCCSSMSFSLSVPNLVCQNTRLGNADRGGGNKKKRSKKRRGRPDSITLFIPLLSLFFPPFPSPLLSLARPSRYCVTSSGKKKAPPCLFHRLPASVCVCVCEPLQGLTIIRSTETDTHLVCLVTEHCVSPNTGIVMRTTIPLFSQNHFNQARDASRTLHL